MSMLATNVRVLTVAMEHTIRRRRGIGPLTVRKLHRVLSACAAGLDKRDAQISTLTAIVKDVAPKRLPKTKRKAKKQ